jgi:hypothetical protein
MQSNIIIVLPAKKGKAYLRDFKGEHALISSVGLSLGWSKLLYFELTHSCLKNIVLSFVVYRQSKSILLGLFYLLCEEAPLLPIYMLYWVTIFPVTHKELAYQTHLFYFKISI